MVMVGEGGEGMASIEIGRQVLRSVVDLRVEAGSL